MEALDVSTIAWMKAQGAYTRSVLDAIKPLAHLKTEVAKFSASFGLFRVMCCSAAEHFTKSVFLAPIISIWSFRTARARERSST